MGYILRLEIAARDLRRLVETMTEPVKLLAQGGAMLGLTQGVQFLARESDGERAQEIARELYPNDDCIWCLIGDRPCQGYWHASRKTVNNALIVSWILTDLGGSALERAPRIATADKLAELHRETPADWIVGIERATGKGSRLKEGFKKGIA